MAAGDRVSPLQTSVNPRRALGSRTMSDGPSKSTLLFAGLTAVLTVGLTLQIRETRRLAALLREVTEMKAQRSGIEEGRPLAPLELLDSTGARVRVTFTEAVGTLLLFHSGGCDACTQTAPRWRAALAEAGRPDVAVVVAQTDGVSGRIDLEGLGTSLSVPLPPVGWHAGLPAVPATLVIDSQGVLVRAWYGALDEPQRTELVDTLTRLGG